MLRILFLLCSLIALPVFAEPSSSALQAAKNLFVDDDDSGILKPDQAFKLSLIAKSSSEINAHFEVAPGHYLYHDRIHFKLNNVEITQVDLPKGEIKKDPNFGELEVYHHSFDSVLHLPTNAHGSVKIEAKYQGCSEKGLCYAPITKLIDVDLPESAATGSISANDSNSGNADENQQIQSLLKGGKLWLIIAGFFGYGLLLSLTPCVFPMIPILSGIIVGRGAQAHKLHSFNLSVSYVMGMAISYTIAGIAAALSGHLISNALQTTWVLATAALIFVLLALSMFGFYELKLPSSFENKMTNISNHLKGGHFVSVFVMGALSALIVSPCVAAPLAGALVYIGQSRDVVLGGTALFFLSIGMGVPLLVVGASAGTLLPKAGAWMEEVKHFFGLLMLGVAIYIISPAIPAALQLVLWAGLLMIPAIYLRALDRLPEDASGLAKFGKGVGVMALVYGVSLLIGALSGAKNPISPLTGFHASATQTEVAKLPFQPVKSEAELTSRLNNAKGKIVMLDFYADWCVACKELEQNTFSDPTLRSALKNAVLLQADVTQNTADDIALLQRFGLYGPPGVIFFDQSGHEIAPSKIVGFKESATFLTAINQANLSKEKTCNASVAC